MPLPSDLLNSVSLPGGGKIAIVMGAGCSFEAPTAIPVAAQCSRECHDRLVANGVLAPGDCADSSDLSCLADAVFAKTNAQKHLVDQLRDNYPLEVATPNEGHRIAAALLREGAVVAVVTLNFDLAMTHSLAQVGADPRIGIINGPHDLPNQKAVNVYYLHRNVYAASPEDWVLRTATLEQQWKAHWEGVITTKVLSAPFVVFAGLGSPAAVLVQSTQLIKSAVPNGTKSYQVDPGDRATSKFFEALGLAPSEYIKVTWCDFMVELSDRLLQEHVAKLSSAATQKAADDGLPDNDITPFAHWLQSVGLLNVGRLRATWLLLETPYCPDVDLHRTLIADLLLAVAMLGRVRNATPVLCADGAVEFRRNGHTIACYLLASGRGTKRWAAIEAKLSSIERQHRGRATQLNGLIISATSDAWATEVTPPADIARDDTSGDILLGHASPVMFHVESLRQNAESAARAIP
jgi:hypothetical protein